MINRVMIAAAVAAAFSAPAFAGLNVGGSAEMNFVMQKTGDGDWSQETDRAFVINVGGDHKLDNGGKMEFRVAQKISEGAKNPTWGNREAWAGLSGDWGSLRLGKQFLNSYLTLDWPYGQGGFWQLAEQGVDWTGKVTAYGFAGDWNDNGIVNETSNSNVTNSFNYLSPSFGGFNFGAQYAWNGSKFGKGEIVDLSANYSAGALGVNAGVLTAKGVGDARIPEAAKTVSGTDSNGDTITITLPASGLTVANPNAGQKDTQLYLGATYAVGNGLNLRGLVTSYEAKPVAGAKKKGTDAIVGLTYGWDKNYVKAAYLSHNTDTQDFSVIKGEFGRSLAANVVWYARLSQQSVKDADDTTQFLTGIWAGF
ncbi:porin [Chitinimonas taiwanensis]|uniref:porin n=1 Tax=Chitinimonas taiwanensis TaxID=240412 RepID=UPI0016231111